ncbi:Presequence protease, mitochondrial [Lamellibrachia satsuma]|nr:Presequence protease, mitochondrial [Lamellibrachia satsuma]
MHVLNANRLLCRNLRLTKQSVRWKTTAVERVQRYKQGHQLHGYTVQEVVPVPELYLTAVMLTHDNTRAQHLHIAREDANNVFGVAFRTTPMDNTGVPHILEHTSLCGSEIFPVRDPFFKMLNRSLSTFMNAFTASDWTMYPFSSQNKQDFENLLSVYLDAAFFPRLRETDFRQEGWRLEHENLNAPDSPIQFKGIVFNEMKGVFSNSQNLFAQKAQNLLYPSHTYSVVSGGDPLAIPDLTWQQLRDFHKSHYHPSNSRFYTYGNFDMEHHLELINEHALKTFSRIEVDTSVPLEKHWDQPREAVISCNPDPMVPDPNKQTTVAVCYLLADITNTFESFTLSILGSLLVSGEKSPFYQALLETNIGSDFSPVLGYDGDTKEASFSVGLQGIKEEDEPRVRQIINDTIDSVIEKGFEAERVEAILHKIELGQKHQSTQFGLHLGVSLLPVWTHDGSPTTALQVNKHVEHFKTALSNNPRFLQEKVKQYFKDNQHRLTLTMKPDAEFEMKRQAEEERKLAKVLGSLSEQDRSNVYKKGLELAEIQSQTEDLSCLPTLRVSDIERESETTELSTVYAGGVPVQLCVQPTNRVTYFRAISDMGSLPPHLEPYVPLFCNVVTRMGARSMDYKDLSEQIDLTTGGLGVSTHVTDHHTDEDLFEKGVVFSSYCLDRNVNKMFELWTEIFNRLDLSDTGRLTTLVMMCAAEMAGSLAGAGHMYVMAHSASSLTAAAQVKEAMSGITQVNLMKSIAEGKDLGAIVQHLKDIAGHLLTAQHLRCAINATPDAIESSTKVMEKFVSGLPSPASQPPEQNNMGCYVKNANFQPHPSETHFELPFQVNYVGRSAKTVPYTHADFSSLRILGRLMTAKYLHREIREKGGAYGGGASGNSPGVVSFFSYRDPNSMKTLDAFDGAVDWAVNGSFTQDDIDEAKLSIFSQVDMPVPPGEKGMRKFLFDIDDAMRQQHREQLFAVSRDDLVRVTSQYLSKENQLSSVTLLGPENPATTNSQDWELKKQGAAH